MQELDKAYEAKKYEDALYKKWEDSGAFKPDLSKDKKPFTISMPPPNATGELHLGHAVMLALEDIMIRFHRMRGYSALWIPGTDHAAIATQSVVEKKLQADGIENPRVELGREKLLEEIRNFVEKSKDTIRNQVRKMGASCDWSREKYTLDEQLNHAVNECFGRMYSDELIYRGDRIVNWDPKMQTTVADDELEHVEEKSKFYYFQYGPFVIGTARPETKFADKVVVVHPDDARYKKYHGQTIELEWINGPIQAMVIADPASDPEFGSGVMTITPAHSMVDFDLSQKYDFAAPQIIDFDGCLKEVAGEFAGMHIEEARDKIVAKLDKKGLLVKVDEDYVHSKAVNYRGKGIVEPQIMKQWFVDVNKQVIDWKGKNLSIKEVLQDTVRSKMINIIPDRFEKTYFHWIDNLRDWCVSRQIWWGHQIPVWYKVSEIDKSKWLQHPEASSFLLQSLNIEILDVEFSESEPTSDGIWIRDPDTLDTWFSSALWTFSTLGWPEKTEELEFFHPTSVLETGYDILFFWVARMILSTTYCLRSDGLPEEQCIPFKNVYLHGLIRTREGKKMSKSNPETCIDPLEMIEKYGADALRLSLFVGASPGNDMKMYEEKISGYRNFVNKLWNVSRYILMSVSGVKDVSSCEPKTLADKWIVSRLHEVIETTTVDIENYHFSHAAENLYAFTWNDLADWYLEISKLQKQDSTLVESTDNCLLYILKQLLKLWHPFTPYVTEQIWSSMLGESDKADDMLITADWPQVDALQDVSVVDSFELLRSVVTSLRRLRAEYSIPPKTKLDAHLVSVGNVDLLEENKDMMQFLGRIQTLHISKDAALPDDSVSDIVSDVTVAMPLKGLIDVEVEKKRLEKEIKGLGNYISGLEKKLGNDKFVANAPKEIVDEENGKLKEAQESLKKFETQRGSL